MSDNDREAMITVARTHAAAEAVLVDARESEMPEDRATRRKSPRSTGFIPMLRAARSIGRDVCNRPDVDGEQDHGPATGRHEHWPLHAWEAPEQVGTTEDRSRECRNAGRQKEPSRETRESLGRAQRPGCEEHPHCGEPNEPA